ncbi:MAG: hypothetical protein WAN86_12690 [Hyphomicrobiaceae bacterium]
MSTIPEPRHVRPQVWRQAIDIARETCARFFRDGRSPDDAMRAYGIAASGLVDWAYAVNVIAEIHCAPAECRHVA